MMIPVSYVVLLCVLTAVAAFLFGLNVGRGGRLLSVSWVTFFFVSVQSLGAPPEALAGALAYARTLTPDDKRRPRYLDVTHFDQAGRESAWKVLSGHLNALSKEPDIVRPLLLPSGVIYFDLREYNIDPIVYGELGGEEVAEPYFHVLLDVTENGKKIRRSAYAPWLPQAQIEELAKLCNSRAAILRADWLVYQTAVAAERKVGYYRILGVGNKEADFQKLVGADPVAAKRLKLEIAAAVAKSTVTLHNRGVRRLQALTGGYWFTQDYKTNTDRQNTIRLPDGDTEPPQGDATEQFAHLPNGMFAYGLFNAQGVRQDTAPDFIAGDGKSTSPDKRVHAMLSCVRCHVEGLRPIADHFRSLFRGDIELRSPDYDRLKRLRQLYLSDMPGQLAEDNFRYARALFRATGLTPADYARLYADFWEAYADADVTPAKAAAELGCAENDLLRRCREYVIKEPLGDIVLSSFGQDPPIPIRREHFEETYLLFQRLLGRIP